MLRGSELQKGIDTRTCLVIDMLYQAKQASHLLLTRLYCLDAARKCIKENRLRDASERFQLATGTVAH